MINIIAWIFASGVGFGLSCWIFGTLLDKSNNMGDFKGDSRDYNAYVNFGSTRVRLRKAKILSEGLRLKNLKNIKSLFPRVISARKRAVSPAKRALLTNSKSGKRKTAVLVILRAYSSPLKRKTTTEWVSDATFSRSHLYLRYQLP